MTNVEAKNLTKIYEVEKQRIYALKEINLEIRKSEFIVLFGPSGSGKTTLLMLLAAIIKPTKGKILYDGVDITNFSEDQAAEWRQKNVGFIFQKINLVEFLNVLDNVLLPVYPRKVDFDKLQAKAEKLIERVGLKDRVNHKPAQLSVGEQQRVAIARALLNNPQIVFADEPTAHLDTETGTKIVKLMKELNTELGTTFVVSTHDPEIAKLADRIIYIRDGRIVKETTQ